MLPEHILNRLRRIHPYQIDSLRPRILPHQGYLHGTITKASEAVRAMRNLVRKRFLVILY